jgi:carboxymethylenebutenolidase
MCHSHDSRPPASPVVTGGVASHGPLEMTAADGNRFAAFRATPEVPNGASLVLLPDSRGLHPFYHDLAQRFAQAGYDTIAIDPYGRSAGTGPRGGDDFDEMKHLFLLEPAHVDADVAAAAAQPSGRIFTVGFCLGGGHSWRQAAALPGIAGAIGFYGPPRFFGDAAPEVKAPLLMLLAGDDTVTSQAEFDAMAADLDAAGREHQMHVYAGAPHSFFDRAHGEWAEACEDAWHRILDFTS